MSRFIVAFAERRGQRHDQIARGKLGDSVDMPHGFANDPDTDRLLSLVPWNLHRKRLAVGLENVLAVTIRQHEMMRERCFWTIQVIGVNGKLGTNFSSIRVSVYRDRPILLAPDLKTRVVLRALGDERRAVQRAANEFNQQQIWRIHREHLNYTGEFRLTGEPP